VICDKTAEHTLVDECPDRKEQQCKLLDSFNHQNSRARKKINEKNIMMC